jgi:sulfur carrier protein
MKIRVNGEQREAGAGWTLRQLLVELGVDPDAKGIAAAVDGEVVPRKEWEERVLVEGCQVEIVRAVAGG